MNKNNLVFQNKITGIVTGFISLISGKIAFLVLKKSESFLDNYYYLVRIIILIPVIVGALMIFFNLVTIGASKNKQVDVLESRNFHKERFVFSLLIIGSVFTGFLTFTSIGFEGGILYIPVIASYLHAFRVCKRTFDSNYQLISQYTHVPISTMSLINVLVQTVVVSVSCSVILHLPALFAGTGKYDSLAYGILILIVGLVMFGVYLMSLLFIKVDKETKEKFKKRK